MPTIKADTGVSFRANANRFALPSGVSATGLAFLQFFGQSAAQSAKNLAPGGSTAPSTVVGTPVIDPEDNVLTQGVNYYQTSVVDTDGMTIMCVASFQPNQQCFPASSAGNGQGFNLYFNQYSAGNYRLVLIRGQTQSPFYTQILGTPNNVVPNTPYFVIGKYSTADNVLRLKNMTTGYSATQNGPSNPVIISGGNFKIGSSNTNTSASTDAGKVNFVALFNRNTTDTEDTLMYAKVKAFYAGRSSPIAI